MIEKKSQVFAQQIITWYQHSGRKHLPWQNNNPYFVWLSEIMLQQTQVIKVVEYFNRFIARFPTLKDLATAKQQDVLALWSGLGYYNRARNLHKAAGLCLQNHACKLPQNLEDLIALPGIGRSTAGAILSLAFDQSVSIMDGNVKRVFSRHFMVDGDPTKSATQKALWTLADAHVSKSNPRHYNQALMDIGATLCTRHKPDCERCPVQDSCAAYANNVVADYPQAKKAVKKQTVELYPRLRIDHGQVYLCQRPAGGIWPELWFLPLEEKRTNYRDDVAFTVEHILTHRRLILNVIVDQTASQYEKHEPGCWVDIDKLSNYPHPVALRKILQIYENSQLH
ncbi:A/G-specific adenine glycosylase [Marinicella sp. W31]|uniref:A/G-specific adenine glycosylase n=1 Tax=Marinicella sp. W31 TaxID=3023713 RepID=UPI00375743C0